MPHADLKYSANLTVDAPAILAKIEAVIQSHDSGAGECKGRAYPADLFHHTHMLVDIAMLNKPHRDAAFMAPLMADLEAAIKAMIPQKCYFSLGIKLSDDYYVTNTHQGG